MQTKQILLLVVINFIAICGAVAKDTNINRPTVHVLKEGWIKRMAGALKAIELPLDVAAARAADRYSYESGGFIVDKNGHGAHLNLLNNPADARSRDDINEYLQELRICEKYWIKAKFYEKDAFLGAGGVIEQHSVPDVLAATEIYFVPVVSLGIAGGAKGNALITTWECITDFKRITGDPYTDAPRVRAGAGGAGAGAGLASEVRNTEVGMTALTPEAKDAEAEVTEINFENYPFEGYTRHPILEKCIYIPRASDIRRGRQDIWEVVTSSRATGVCS